MHDLWKIKNNLLVILILWIYIYLFMQKYLLFSFLFFVQTGWVASMGNFTSIVLNTKSSAIPVFSTSEIIPVIIWISVMLDLCINWKKNWVPVFQPVRDKCNLFKILENLFLNISVYIRFMFILLNISVFLKWMLKIMNKGLLKQSFSG